MTTKPEWRLVATFTALFLGLAVYAIRTGDGELLAELRNAALAVIFVTVGIFAVKRLVHRRGVPFSTTTTYPCGATKQAQGREYLGLTVSDQAPRPGCPTHAKQCPTPPQAQPPHHVRTPGFGAGGDE